PEQVAELGGLMLPALHVGLGPSVPAEGIEFLSGRDDGGHWLYAAGDILVAKIVDRPVTLLLTSVRAAGTQPLDIEVDRLDARSEPRPAGAPIAPDEPEPQGERTDEAEAAVRLQVSAHISNRGDVVFIDTDWSGRLAMASCAGPRQRMIRSRASSFALFRRASRLSIRPRLNRPDRAAPAPAAARAGRSNARAGVP